MTLAALAQQCYAGFALALFAIATKLERGWRYWAEIDGEEGSWYGSGDGESGGDGGMGMGGMDSTPGPTPAPMTMNMTMMMMMDDDDWWKPVCNDRRHPILPAWCFPHFWNTECPAE